MEEINEELHMSLLNFDEEKRRIWMEERKPFSVLFELTAKCNMNCIHCYLQNFHAESEMSYERIIEIIDLLYDKGILFLTFTGGEILTRKDFLDIYVYAKKKGFLVELFTNGYLFNDEIIDVLKEYPPLLVDISIYGANEETYYRVTGIKNAYKTVIKNVLRLKNAGVRVSLKSPIIDITLPELENMKKIADNIGVPFVYTFEICSTIDKDNAPRNHQVGLDIALGNEFKNYYEQVEKGIRREVSNYDEIIGALKQNKMVYSCNVALNSFVIDYKGNMCPCMKLRHRGIYLQKLNYDAIWEDFGKYSKIPASESYKCKGCDAIYYCDVCPAEMDLLYDDAEYRPEFACKSAYIRKAFYEDNLSFEQAIKKAK
jgi:radical SAM protein with 4Fe4S-binding SPASM domain